MSSKLYSFEQLAGNWVCKQKSQISERLIGVNNYTVTYFSSNLTAEQFGAVSIKDSVSKIESKLKYRISFTFQSNKNEFEIVAKTLDLQLVSDDLNIFSEEPLSAFPKIGEKVKGKFVFIEDDILRNEYADGTTVDCRKQSFNLD